jgi:hypothetical protein
MLGLAIAIASVSPCHPADTLRSSKRREAISEQEGVATYWLIERSRALMRFDEL